LTLLPYLLLFFYDCLLDIPDRQVGKLSVRLDHATCRFLNRFPFHVNETQRLSNRRNLPRRMLPVPVVAASCPAHNRSAWNVAWTPTEIIHQALAPSVRLVCSLSSVLRLAEGMDVSSSEFKLLEYPPFSLRVFKYLNYGILSFNLSQIKVKLNISKERRKRVIFY